MDAAPDEHAQHESGEQGGRTAFAEKDVAYYLRMIQDEFEELAQVKKKGGAEHSGKPVVLVTGDTLGRGPEPLGKRLLTLFIKSLLTSPVKPKVLILMNGAVPLAQEGSELIESLTLLEEQGVRILVSAETADHYGTEEKIRVGQVAHMSAITELLLTAEKVISL
ncbi:MAG: hypothetical protein HYU64_06625 [Armatimonadetes bacterium]|nr:hypothetical protein [Armatimonadota bacterium]